MNELKPGDVCTYSFGGENRSCAVVEIVRILNDKRGVAEVRVLKVIVDDTGNGYFDFLYRTCDTMNASFAYLRKLDANQIRELEPCPYCHEDREGHFKMFGAFSLRTPFHKGDYYLNGGNLKPRRIYACPLCGRRL